MVARTTLPVLDAALDYAARGLPVLILHGIRNGACTCTAGPECDRSPGKHPRTAHGKDDATADPRVIRRLLDRWPDSNIGIRPIPGLVVLDVDPRNGGDRTLAALERQHGELPRTRTAITGSDGLHYWWKGTATVGTIGAGLDVKTAAGYVVAPPSVHLSGGTYAWCDESATAPAPAWLAALLAPAPPARPTRPLRPERVGTRQDVAGILAVTLAAQQGGRNAALHWSACRLWERVADGRLTEHQVEGMLTDAASSIGLSDRETRATIASARRSVPGA